MIHHTARMENTEIVTRKYVVWLVKVDCQLDIELKPEQNHPSNEKENNETPRTYAVKKKISSVE